MLLPFGNDEAFCQRYAADVFLDQRAQCRNLRPALLEFTL